MQPQTDNATSGPAPTAADAPARAPSGKVAKDRRRARRIGRFILRAALIVLLLLVLLVVIGQLILASSLPRRMALGLLQKHLGLRIQAKSMQVGWFGKTTMRNVTLALPLARHNFLTVREMDIRNTWLPWLLITRKVHISAVTLEHPVLTIQQNSAGHWNILQVAQLIKRATSANPKSLSKTTAQSTSIALPHLIVTHGTVRINPYRRPAATIGHVWAHGQKQGSLVWRFAARAGNAKTGPWLKISGTAAPGRSWSHTLVMKSRDIGTWIEPFAAMVPAAVSANARWNGAFGKSGLSGQVNLQTLAMPGAIAHGSAAVVFTKGVFTVAPRSLTVSASSGFPILLNVGKTTLGKGAFTMRHLGGSVAGGSVAANGIWRFSGGRGKMTVSWRHVRMPSAGTTAGNAVFTTTQPYPHHKSAHVDITAHGTLPGGGWNTVADVRVKGPAWSNLAWRLDLPKLVWAGRQRINLSNATLAGRLRRRVLTLRTVRQRGEPVIRARGYYRFATGVWLLHLHMNRALSSIGAAGPLGLTILAHGSRQSIVIHHLAIYTSRAVLWAMGDYVFARPRPLHIQVRLKRLPIGPRTISAGPLRVRGSLHGNLIVNGTVRPMRLSAKGLLYAHGVAIGPHLLGDVKSRVRGAVNAKMAWLKTQQLDALGGNWQVTARYPLAASTAGLPSAAEVHVRFGHIQLARISGLVAFAKSGMPTATKAATGKGAGAKNAVGVKPMLSGLAAGDLRLLIPKPTLRRLRATGTLHLNGVAIHLSALAAAALKGRLRADSVNLDWSLAKGILRITRLTLKNGAGTGGGAASLAVNDPARVSLNVHVVHWPIPLAMGTARAVATARFAGTAQVARREAWGTLVLSSIFYAHVHDKRPIADIATTCVMRRQYFDLKTIRGHILGARISGSSRFTLQKPLEARGALAVSGLRASAIAALYPKLKGLRGVVSAHVTVHPTRGPHPLAPLQVRVAVNAPAVRWRHLRFGNAKLLIFVGHDDLLVDQSALTFAGGGVHLFADISHHPGSGRTGQINARFFRLSLRQIAQRGKRSRKPLPGQLSGQATLVVNPNHPDDSFGRGDVIITKSDLASTPIFSALYNLMHVKLGNVKPDGHGYMHFHLERGSLAVTRLLYINRGVRVRAGGTVRHIMHFPNCPLHGFAVGSLRPFSHIKLPLLGKIDQILGALQGGVTTVEIGGTVKAPKPKPIVLKKLGKTLQHIFVGETR